MYNLQKLFDLQSHSYGNCLTCLPACLAGYCSVISDTNRRCLHLRRCTAIASECKWHAKRSSSSWLTPVRPTPYTSFLVGSNTLKKYPGSADLACSSALLTHGSRQVAEPLISAQASC